MRSVVKHNSPWDIHDAFDPMFDEEVVIESGGRRQTLKCVVFADNSGDALMNDIPETNRSDIAIQVRHQDWAFVNTLELGDKVKRTINGKVIEYGISEVVDDFTMGKRILARSTSNED